MYYQTKLYHMGLSGTRIEGIIRKCEEEMVYLQLDIDSEERADYPWCWTPETSNLCYCMPEVGTKAVLYLPTKEEKDGQVILASVSYQEKQEKNVEQREFQTKDQKKIGLYPDRLFLEGTEKKELLSLEDTAGIRLFSEKAISFQAAGMIKISGRVITGAAPFEVVCRTKRANIAICRDLNFYAPEGVKTIGNGKRSDKERMTEQKEREEKEKPEYWMLAYAALGAIPAVYLPDITGTKDLAALFALGSIPIVGRADVIVSLAEVMEGKREKETTFPDAFHSMENYVVKGGYELPGVAAAEERKEISVINWNKNKSFFNKKRIYSHLVRRKPSCFLMCTGSMDKDEYLKENDINRRFSRCGFTKGDCIKTVKMLRKEKWKPYHINIFSGSKNVVKMEEHFTECKNGNQYGIIYRKYIDEKVKEGWETIDGYVTEENLEMVGWKMEYFEKQYKREYKYEDENKTVKETKNEMVLEDLKLLMLEAGITKKESIFGFFAATVESKGKLLEDYDSKENYEEEVKGVGLVQVTADAQKRFIQWLEEYGYDFLLEIREYQKEEDGEQKSKELIENLKKYIEKEENDGISRAVFLSKHCALEINVWYWKYFERFSYELGGKSYVTIDELFERFATEKYHVDNVFLASQTALNGSLWGYERLIKIAMEQDKNKYWVRAIREEEVYKDEFLNDNSDKPYEKPKKIGKTDEKKWIDMKAVEELNYQQLNLTEPMENKGNYTELVLTREAAEHEEHENDTFTYVLRFEEEGSHYGCVAGHWGKRYYNWLKINKKWKKKV